MSLRRDALPRVQVVRALLVAATIDEGFFLFLIT